MSCDQVRWKFNTLMKKYKECIDNNSASGRGAMNFEFYDQMEEIFGRQSNAVGTCVRSSTLPSNNSDTSTSKQQRVSQSDSKLSTSTSANIDSFDLNVNSSKKRKRPQHGSGSNKAKANVELQKQWSLYLHNKENRDSLRDEKLAKLEESKREMVKLKKRQVALREKELECRKEIATKKRIERANRHTEIMEMERQKCELLTKLISKKNVRDTSDSD